MSDALVIFTRTYDFVTWILPLAEKFPKSQRFVVTQRLQNSVLNFQESLIEANSLRGAKRIEKLRFADAELRKTRLYLRLCEKWNWMTMGQYNHASTMVAEIGRLLGGWMKYVVPEPS
ncbi:MAG: diversity-generating retroelement protein Avd [Anaerolineales bacterium]|nr:diversity-generating retroelement protein Avd [Anaerolineales bacterium]